MLKCGYPLADASADIGLKLPAVLPFTRQRPVMELVNGYYCRKADAELAKKGVDPMKTKQATNVAAAQGSLQRSDGSTPELGVNRVSSSGNIGRRLNLYA